MGELSGLLFYVWFTRWVFMPTPDRQRGRERGRERGGTLKRHAQEFFFFLIRPKATCRDQGKHVGFHA